MLSSAVNPWGILAAVAIGAGLWGLGRWQGYDAGVNSARAAQAKALAAKQEEIAEKDRGYREKAAELAQANKLIGDLLAYRPDPKVLTREIVREVPVNAPCSCPDRSPEYRLQYNAIADGRPGASTPRPVPAAAADRAAVPPP